MSEFYAVAPRLAFRPLYRCGVMIREDLTRDQQATATLRRRSFDLLG
jgi:hypothetical protein